MNVPSRGNPDNYAPGKYTVRLSDGFHTAIQKLSIAGKD